LDLYLRAPTGQALMSSQGFPIVKELRLYDPQAQVWLLSYEESEQYRLQAEQALTQTEQALVQKQQALDQAIAQLEATGMSREAISQLLGIALD